MQMAPQTGRVNYEPNSLDPNGPRETGTAGFVSFPAAEEGNKLRIRPESFADHYTQARMFFVSQTEPEQDHIIAALIFELSKVETPAIRERMLGHLVVIDPTLGNRVAAGLGVKDVTAAKSAVKPLEMDPSPALSIIAKLKPSLDGRCIGLLVADGANAGLVNSIVKAAQASGAVVKTVAEKISGATLSDGKMIAADFRVDGAPSALFDSVAIIADDGGAARLAGMGWAQDFVRDAYAHLKTIGFTPNLKQLFTKAGLAAGDLDEACIELTEKSDAQAYVDMAEKGKLWDREPKVRPLPAVTPVKRIR